MEEVRRIRARYVFPAAGRPIVEGTLAIRGDRIVGVGSRSGQTGVENLGNVAILPGFVNAHTHLDFSGVKRPLGEPGIRLPDWIGQVIAWRNRQSDFRGVVGQGLAESIRLGTTTLGEIAQADWPVEVFEHSRTKSIVFLELIAPTQDRVEPAMGRAQRHVQCRGSGWTPGVSPHAPYTVRPDLLDQAATLCATCRAPLAFHLAESREELELLRTGTGPLADFLRGLDSWDPGVVRPPARPLDYLRRLVDASRVLVVHGNYLDRDEIDWLAEHRESMSVVYCPRTHEYFAHQRYPLEEMLAAGVSICLGTDSRASSPDLSMLAEMRAVARRHTAVDPHTVLELATSRAARALGLDREVGSIEPGKRADLAVVALPECDTVDPYEALLDGDLPVVATWCGGEEVFRSGSGQKR